MIESVKNWYLAQTIRERILLGFAAILTLATIAVFLITIPLLNAIAAQKSEYRTALDRRAVIEAKAKRFADAKPSKRTKISADELRSIVDISAGEAGFTLDRADARKGGIVDVAIANARPAALMQWLLDLQARGAVVSNVEINPSGGGSVSFTATFADAP